MLMRWISWVRSKQERITNTKNIFFYNNGAGSENIGKEKKSNNKL